MFEKEAEEYREKEKDKGYYWVTQEMEQSELDTIIDESFKDGAEFGYNKVKEELKEKIEKMKNCQNCKHHYYLYEELMCRIHKIAVDTCNSWEVKEND